MIAQRALLAAVLLVVAAGRGAAAASGQVSTSRLANEVPQVRAVWQGSEVTDLFKEYNNIFRHGNRNAASHLWVHFLLERSEQMTNTRLLNLFGGFCAVSGSPVRPSDFNRYKLTLDRVDGSGKVAGFMHYCCWPCVCDTQDFIRVDTRRVATSDGEKTYNFAVIGNPCDHEEELSKPFQDAVGRGMSMLRKDAPEVRCKDGVLEGAPLSDHGYVIIGMFFDAPAALNAPTALAVAGPGAEQPGRMTEVGGAKFQDEREYEAMCEDRKRNGYNSGMGEIFRRVASISPVQIPSALSAIAGASEVHVSGCDSSLSGSCKEALPDGQAAAKGATGRLVWSEASNMIMLVIACGLAGAFAAVVCARILAAPQSPGHKDDEL
mmetsp:Transcript_86648/g.279842  ORF Transcript_86648/g.279842 Transcript_86648/m.279842 type:complete len:378 (-) Transcript_86648:65-1198(-)